MTSGDVEAAQQHGTVGPTSENRQVTPPVAEPLLVVALETAPQPGIVPEGARFKVTTDQQVAYFDGHGGAFSWQAVNGGKLRTVR